MAIGLRLKDRLVGSENFSPWKARIVLILQENELRDIVENSTAHPIVVPAATDAATLSAFNKDIKAKRIIFDVVKDHVNPHISAKNHAHDMWSALTHLYESSNENQKMVLREIEEYQDG